jgi:hypothetical protein
MPYGKWKAMAPAGYGALAQSENAPGTSPHVVFFDLETTIPVSSGEKRRILQFGAIEVEMETMFVLSRTSMYFALDAQVLDLGTRVHRSPQHVVNRSKPFRESAQRLYELLDRKIWGGHNIVAFDIPLLMNAFDDARMKRPECLGIIDTMVVYSAWDVARHAGNIKLDTLSKFVGLGTEEHDAYSDSELTLEVLRRLTMGRVMSSLVMSSDVIAAAESGGKQQQPRQSVPKNQAASSRSVVGDEKSEGEAVVVAAPSTKTTANTSDVSGTTTTAAIATTTTAAVVASEPCATMVDVGAHANSSSSSVCGVSTKESDNTSHTAAAMESAPPYPISQITMYEKRSACAIDAAIDIDADIPEARSRRRVRMMRMRIDGSQVLVYDEYAAIVRAIFEKNIENKRANTGVIHLLQCAYTPTQSPATEYLLEPVTIMGRYIFNAVNYSEDPFLLDTRTYSYSRIQWSRVVFASIAALMRN